MTDIDIKYKAFKGSTCCPSEYTVPEARAWNMAHPEDLITKLVQEGQRFFWKWDAPTGYFEGHTTYFGCG